MKQHIPVHTLHVLEPAGIIPIQESSDRYQAGSGTLYHVYRIVYRTTLQYITLLNYKPDYILNTSSLPAVLGSGGMIFQSLSIYSVAIIFEECPSYRDLVVTAADLLVSGLQVLFLVKFLSVGILLWFTLFSCLK